MIQRRFVIEAYESSNKILYTTDSKERVIEFFKRFCPDRSEPVEVYDTEPVFKKFMDRNFDKDSTTSAGNIAGAMGGDLLRAAQGKKDTNRATKLMFKRGSQELKKGVRSLVNDIKGNYHKSGMSDYGLLMGKTIVDFPKNENGDLICTDIDIKGAVESLITMYGEDCNLNTLDVSMVTKMDSLFASHKKYNGDISQWSVSRVTDMSDMFKGSKFNGNISNWNTSQVTDMSKMFAKSEFNQDIGNWNTSNVTKMSKTFVNSQFTKDISQWDVSKVTNMKQMFKSSKFNGDISQWNMSNVVDVDSMFEESEFNKDIGNWKLPKVTSMKRMFEGSKFNGDISQWDVSKVTNMSRMFQSSNFNSDISSWDVSRVKKMKDVFKGSDFKGDTSNWDTSESEKHQKTQQTVIIVALVIGLIAVGVWFYLSAY
jgi:surface protein